MKAAWGEQISAWFDGDVDLSDDREVVCPVCGSYKPLSRSFLLHANLDRYPVVKSVRKENKTVQSLMGEGVNLREISHREDLGWLRRQMTYRCADIIKKFSSD